MLSVLRRFTVFNCSFLIGVLVVNGDIYALHQFLFVFEECYVYLFVKYVTTGFSVPVRMRRISEQEKKN